MTVNRDSADIRMLKEAEVRAMTGLSRVTRWRMEDRGEFPQRVLLGARRVSWVESEVVAWLEDRIKNHRRTIEHRDNG